VTHLRVPLERLPQNAGERHGALRNYFCDKDATAVLIDGVWELVLAWPGGEERHVDPRLDVGLRMWGGISRDQMALAQRRSGRVLRSLYDTWTLQSWSEWFARSRLKDTESLTILHVDDHRDLGEPRLFKRGEAWIDPIAGRAFDLCRPKTVRSAIESGAIGMGSFLTPVIHRFPRVDVRQLGQAPKVVSTIDYELELSTMPDDLLDPGAPRPSVNLRPTSSGIGPGRYRITDDPMRWVEDLGPGPILLHIDMDYFNNRYDGDGDWRDRPVRLDPGLSEVLTQVDRVTAALRAEDILPRIRDCVIAYSPGFFPAELWEEADHRLEAGMEELYV